jgi:phosphatidylinositol-3-phosphatase
MRNLKWIPVVPLAFLACQCGRTTTTLGSSGTGVGAANQVTTVFVIAMENHNWTQPANQFTGGTQQIFQNSNAPFINSLVNGTAVATIGGASVNISQQVAYATAYHNVLATPGGNTPGLHPSEPNYIWAEAGVYLGLFSDNDPYNGGANQNSPLHLSNLLTGAGKSWRSYQEDIDLAVDGNGLLTNVPLPRTFWTVPLTSFSGTFANGNFNSYNGSNQYSYAAKHNPMVFFTDTNGGNNPTSSNPLSLNYAPLQLCKSACCASSTLSSPIRIRA